MHLTKETGNVQNHSIKPQALYAHLCRQNELSGGNHSYYLQRGRGAYVPTPRRWAVSVAGHRGARHTYWKAGRAELNPHGGRRLPRTQRS